MRTRLTAVMDPEHSSSSAPTTAAAASSFWRSVASGFILGMLLWIGARELGVRAIPVFRSSHVILVAGLLGGVLALTRARSGLWIAAGAVCLALLVVGYTPLVPSVVNAWVRSDPLRPSEAVVSLSSEVFPDGTLDDHAQLRILHAYELLTAGMAHRLVLTRIVAPRRSSSPAVQRQMRALRLDFPVDEVGPVVNTHDEAVVVARLARERGWKRVILVSDPLHLRRAAAVFTHAGLAVCCSPCDAGSYDLNALDSPGDRLAAFRDWLKEVIGCQIYRRRGWM